MAFTVLSLSDYYTRAEYIVIETCSAASFFGYTWCRLSDGTYQIVKNAAIGLPVKVRRHPPQILRVVNSDIIIIKPWNEDPFEISYNEAVDHAP